MKNEDKAYTSNYPRLKEWLRKHEARCDWQIMRGRADAHHEYVERWSIGARHFLVVVRSHKMGWDIYTECGSRLEGATFDDAEARIGLTKPKQGVVHGC